MPTQNRISRVLLKNYKSIRECDVTLGPLTFLVGPNGAGKSNFVEALRFVSYALSQSLEQALDARSGFRNILHKGADRALGITFEIFFSTGDQTSGRYLVQISDEREGPVSVLTEECSLTSEQGEAYFRVQRGKVTSNQGVMPAASEDKLYLVNASGLAAFEPVYRTLSGIVVYNPVPDESRGFKPERRFRNLDRTGSGLAETIHNMKSSSPARLARVIQYLAKITPGIRSVESVSVEDNYNLKCDFAFPGMSTKEFTSQNISDGTLRALAVLVALFQRSDRYPLTLTGLEEPEAGLHPSAANVLFDAMVEGSDLSQVLVTSHSPDLLDREDVAEEAIMAVEMCEGRTIIGHVDRFARSALRDRLYTPGELLRMNQIRPEGIPDCTDAR